jgi:nicotinamide-nucleotide amidase
MQNGHFSECDRENLDKKVTNVVKLLEQDNLTIAVAESCTGGLLSELITSVPGASEVYELGVCTYSEKMKTKFLGVPEKLIEKYGVVSSEVADAMVRGLKKCSAADVCISVTGVAGPGGGTEKTPVGTVFIGFDICGKQFVKLPELWLMNDKSREKIRFAAADFAFGIVEEILTEAVQK